MKTLAEIRNELCQLAEISGQEFQTADYIVNYLNSLGFDVITGFAGLSVIGINKGYKQGPSVLFRAELDALPSLSGEYGKAQHRCGHDGHMAVLLGLALYLSSHPPINGNVILLFQSAEETGQGALAIQSSGILEQLKPDFVFAFHNLPGYSGNCLVYRQGVFTANVESLCIDIKGIECHAAEPHNGINPALAIAEIVFFLNRLQNTDTLSEEYFLSTPIGIEMGGKGYGTSAGEAVIQYTFRAWDKHLFERNCRSIENFLVQLSKSYAGISLTFKWLEPFSACYNNPDAISILRSAAAKTSIQSINVDLPFTWGEDFGVFTNNFKGAIFGIGSGISHPPLHHLNYSFPDHILDTALQMFVSVYKEVCDR